MKPRFNTKTICTIALLTMAVLFAALSVIGIFAASGGKPYDSRKGVVWVVEQASAGDDDYMVATGTGWAVGVPGKPVEYIITNGHVVYEAYELPKMNSKISGTVQVYFSAATNDYVTCEVVYFSPPEEKDIAILKLPNKTDKRSALRIRSSQKVEIGSESWALGYPGITSENEQYSSFSEDDVTITRGIISKKNRPLSSSYEAFQTDTYINHGNSGGPLVDKNGYVIGINSAGIGTEDGSMEGVNYAITSDELIKILDTENISYSLTGISQYWMTILFLPLTIITAIGGILLLLTPGGLKQLVGGMKSKPDSKTEAKDKCTVILRGITGIYAGQTFPLGKGLTVIGRDPSKCNIIYDSATPGISGCHCQLSYDPEKDVVLITDLGSSYGTFLDNGKKLSSNVSETMHVGEGFYIGNDNNRFVIGRA